MMKIFMKLEYENNFEARVEYLVKKCNELNTYCQEVKS